jgi:hypothetical protein
MRQLLIILLLLPLIWGCRKESTVSCDNYNDTKKVLVISDRIVDNYYDYMIDSILPYRLLTFYCNYPYDEVRWMLGSDSSRQNSTFTKPSFKISFGSEGRVKVTMIGTKRFSENPCSGKQVINDTLVRFLQVTTYSDNGEIFSNLNGIYLGHSTADPPSVKRTVEYRRIQIFPYITFNGIPVQKDTNYEWRYYDIQEDRFFLSIDSAEIETQWFYDSIIGCSITKLDYKPSTRQIRFDYQPFYDAPPPKGGRTYQSKQTFVGYKQ